MQLKIKNNYKIAKLNEDIFGIKLDRLELQQDLEDQQNLLEDYQ